MKAVIARSDLLTAYGRGIQPLWAGLIANQTAITGSPVFAGSQPVPHKLAMIPDLQLTDQISRARAMLDQLLSPLSGRLDPQTPMILATTVGEIEFIQRAVLQSDPGLADLADPQLLLKHVQQLLGLRGPAMVLSSACASSAAALSQAASVVRRGQSPAVLVITCDAISELVYSGFTTLLSLCETTARPFDAGRCGLSLGEATAWALVTTEDSKLADAQSPAILGWASTTDAVHMTAPDRNAGGLSRAISAACAMASIQAKQIGLIAAHGTATLYNDAMELTAFRNSLPAPVPVFSIKGGTGHALAAAGLVQILVAAHALQQRLVPPTVGLLEPDESAVGWARNKPVPLTDESIALSTNSGFGGSLRIDAGSPALLEQPMSRHLLRSATASR
jgi:3-oxoacyl-[acyl-carrier-protein] synthase II